MTTRADLVQQIYDALRPDDDLEGTWPLSSQMHREDFADLSDNIEELLIDYSGVLDAMRPVVRQFLVERGYLHREEGGNE